MPQRTLIGFAMIALSERDVSPTYRKMVLAHVKSFARWKGRAVRIGELNCDDVNEWLDHLRTTLLSAETVDTYRRNLLTIWREAFSQGKNNHPPLRVRRIKKPRRIVHAYTHAELRQLILAAKSLKGRHKNGNRRAYFWCALIHSAYSTGLRRGDLLLVFRANIEPDGTYRLIQHKTGVPLTVRFSPDALAYIALLKDANGLALPWPYRKDAMVPRFNALKKLAGITRGSLKWIRRAAGSHAEREEPGAGPRLLGNSPHVFKASYGDQSIIGHRPIEPPPLGIIIVVAIVSVL